MSSKLMAEVEPKIEMGRAPSNTRVMPSGIAAAALIASMLGMLTLAVVNVVTTASKDFNAWVHGVGKLWMPGAAGIGPYSGKETISLVVWLGTWIVLHYALRERELRLSTWLVVFLVGVAVATTLIWPPVFEHLAEYLVGH